MHFRVSFGKLIGPKGEQTMAHIGFTKLMVSMGHQASGALELMNYPAWLRDLVPHDPNGYDRPDHIDLAALESKSIRSKPFVLCLYLYIVVLIG